MSASSDTSLKVWDLTRGSCTSTLKPHSDYIQALAYSPLTETVVSAGLDHELYLWDVNALTSLTASKNTVTSKRERERRKLLRTQHQVKEIRDGGNRRWRLV